MIDWLVYCVYEYTAAPCSYIVFMWATVYHYYSTVLEHCRRKF